MIALLFLFFQDQQVDFSADALYDQLEFFAGHKAMTLGFEFFHYRTCTFELLDDILFCDLLTDVGFINAAVMVAKMKPCAIAIFAPVCSSWIFVSRHKTGRSTAYPLGIVQYGAVHQANIMVTRCVLLILLLVAKGGIFVLENPQPSSIFRRPAFQMMPRLLRIFTYTLDLRRLGATTKKPITCYSNVPWLHELEEFFYVRMPTAQLTGPTTTKVWNDEQGKWKVTGVADRLKETQRYPIGFGRAMAQLFRRNGRCLIPEELSDEWVGHCDLRVAQLLCDLSGADLFEDACLASVFEFLE